MPENYYDLLIRQARLRGNGDEICDIGITDGYVAAIESNLECSAKNEIDAKMNLVTESFVNTHLHLCKVWTLAKLNEVSLKEYHGDGMSRAMIAIARAREVKRQLDYNSITAEARRAVALSYG
jgi:cytosine deaminase